MMTAGRSALAFESSPLPPAERRDLVLQMYDAVGDERALAVVFERIGEIVKVGAIGGQSFDHLRKRPRKVVAVAGQEDMLRDYHAHYSSCNVWMIRGRHLVRPGAMILSSEMYPVSELPKTEWYNDFLRPRELFYSAGVVVGVEKDVTSTIAFMRGRGEGDYTPSEVEFLRGLGSHIRNVLRLQPRIEEAGAWRASQKFILDLLPMGVVLYDCFGVAVQMNWAAGEILDQADGLRCSANGLLVTTSPGSNEALRRMIAGACRIREAASEQGCGMTRVERPSGAPDYELWAAPLPARGVERTHGNPAVILFITDPDRSADLPIQALVRCYGLTPAQARLAALLVHGVDLRDSAVKLGITVQTARAHIKQIFTKTGVRRQTELVRLLLLDAVRLKLHASDRSVTREE